jgi:flagellar biosynthesis GTPase FlhF
MEKGLLDLIDETIHEVEELIKSRMSAVEGKIGDSDSGMAGMDANGELESSKKSEHEEEEKDKKEEEEEKEKESSEMEKAEDEEEKKEEKEDEEKEKEDEEKEEEDEEEKKKKHPYKEETKEAAKEILEMHKSSLNKSLKKTETLLKSYVDERIKPIEEKLSSLLDVVNKIANQPLPQKGFSVKTSVLAKSSHSGETVLSKSELVNKLLELKKSGHKVDTLDIAKVDTGLELQQIAEKYNIK